MHIKWREPNSFLQRLFLHRHRRARFDISALVPISIATARGGRTTAALVGSHARGVPFSALAWSIVNETGLVLRHHRFRGRVFSRMRCFCRLPHDRGYTLHVENRPAYPISPDLDGNIAKCPFGVLLRRQHAARNSPGKLRMGFGQKAT
jgi:hypothetical protein